MGDVNSLSQIRENIWKYMTLTLYFYICWWNSWQNWSPATTLQKIDIGVGRNFSGKIAFCHKYVSCSKPKVCAKNRCASIKMTILGEKKQEKRKKTGKKRLRVNICILAFGHFRWVTKILCFQSFRGKHGQKQNCKGRIGCAPIILRGVTFAFKLETGNKLPFHASVHVTFMSVLNENLSIWFSHFSSLKTGEHTKNRWTYKKHVNRWTHIHPYVEQALMKTFPRMLKYFQCLGLFNITSGWRVLSKSWKGVKKNVLSQLSEKKLDRKIATFAIKNISKTVSKSVPNSVLSNVKLQTIWIHL